jgi:hypothetical protein
MDILFTRDELATHTIDPMRSEMPSLDADKINMIKGLHLNLIRSDLNLITFYIVLFLSMLFEEIRMY